MSQHVVLLDDRGAAIGTAPKDSVHDERTPLHLGFSCYLVNPAGEVLLTRRAATKLTWPGVWTNSCCGHPQPGESITHAVGRRLRDELGVGPHRLDLILPRFRYRAVMPNGIAENEICPVFRASLADGAVLGLDPREVQEACWVSWHFFSVLAADPEQPVSPWCRRQAARLSRLGDDPRRWPASSLAELIPAAFPPQAP